MNYKNKAFFCISVVISMTYGVAQEKALGIVGAHTHDETSIKRSDIIPVGALILKTGSDAMAEKKLVLMNPAFKPYKPALMTKMSLLGCLASVAYAKFGDASWAPVGMASLIPLLWFENKITKTISMAREGAVQHYIKHHGIMGSGTSQRSLARLVYVSRGSLGVFGISLALSSGASLIEHHKSKA
jgi:hypothetical protein